MARMDSFLQSAGDPTSFPEAFLNSSSRLAPYQKSRVAKILVVDDEEPIRILLRHILEMSNYHCRLAADAAEARTLLGQEDFSLILCDINMPGESGIDFIRYAVSEYPKTAAVMISVMSDPMVADYALERSVYDFIIKPFEPNSVLISVANALRRRQLEMDNQAYSESLQRMVEERTDALEESMGKLRKALEGSIQAMARAVETRDPYTAGHQERVADLARAIAIEMKLPKDKVEGVRMAGVIHDLGKISVPAEILSKTGKISDIEFSLIKTHPTVSYEILRPIDFPWPIARMVLQHHERENGSGYPSGLKRHEILLEAKILSVADVVEAMASHRPYRPALGVGVALEEISEHRGTLYDSDVVKACVRLFQEKRFTFS